MYFTVFTGIESIPPGMSDLGVIISIELSYAMWHEGRRGSEEVSSPDMHEGMPHGDAARFLMQLTIARNQWLWDVCPIASSLGSDLNF